MKVKSIEIGPKPNETAEGMKYQVPNESRGYETE